MSGVFVEKVVIHSVDVDMYNRWKPSAIFASIQECSGHHMETIHSSRDELLVNNLAWVVARSKLEMTRYPKNGEKITFKTWAANPIKFIYPRYTVMEDEQGMEIGKAVVLWSVIDLGTHNLVVAPEQVVKFFEFDKNPMIILSFPTKLEFGNLDSNYTYQAGFSDMDINQHINNAKYLDWIYNALDPKYLATHTPKSIQINYQTELLMGDIVGIDWALEGSTMKVTGSAGGRISFHALLEF